MVAFERPPIDGFVSVIIPVFEDADGLTDTLTSLRRQTLPSSEYEVIVANDGGAPAVSEVCERFSVREVRIVPNSGSYNARNRGMEGAAGEYLAFVDADIEVQETWLAVGREALKSADYVGGPIIIREELATTPARHHDMVTGFRSQRADNKSGVLLTGNLFVIRTVIDEMGGFDERLRSGGDNEFANRLFRNGTYRRRFDANLTVFHPPRDYRELVNKRIRLVKGRRTLNQLYPDRYDYRRPSLNRQLLSILIPPRVTSVRRRFRGSSHFSFLAYYLFRWRFRTEVSLRLLPVYYGTSGRSDARIR